ncbi:hypothetical protein GQ44DRAFT_690874 [Phaeosphaeriaceae sp. PMI808]|nr:hypothetical protein GQ44DRAFT_690874 [Phaeosphaeriaceae sp. PMI808]
MFIDTATANGRSVRPRIVISPRTSPYNETSTPLLETFVGQEPPPTYLEATTPGLYSSRLSEDQGARLLTDGDREARDAAIKEDKYRRRGLKGQCSAGRWAKLVAALLAILIIFGAVVAMAAAISAKHHRHGHPKGSKTPVESSVAGKLSPPTLANPSGAETSLLSEGFIGDEGERPDLIAIPWPTPSPSGAQPPSPLQSKQVFPIRWPTACGKEYNVKVDEYNFGTPKKLDIQEAIHRADGGYKKVSGWIHVVRAPSNQAPGTIQARLSYAVSPSVNTANVKHTATENSIMIGDPTYIDGFDGIRPRTACLGISLVVYMAADVEIETLNIAGTHIGIQFHEGVNFKVTNSTRISLTKGTLDTVALNSRETYLSTISGSISGMYALHELLSIKSKSGSVNIDIAPMPAAPGSTKPAVFMVDAISSSVRTDFKRKRIPERDYQIYINTTVGSVDGRLIHGSRTEINSVAGFVNADLLPFKSGDYASTIYTNTQSGQTSVTLRSPYKAKNVPMTRLTSVHKTTSGELDLRYPEEWVGHVNGTSMSGALHMQGLSLELLGENTEPQKNHVEAKKGSGGSKLEFDSVSGACEIKIGKT